MDDVATGGRTVLFVSHNMTAIRNLCGRAMVLNKGHLDLVADVEEAIDAYEEPRLGLSRNNLDPAGGAGERGNSTTKLFR